MKDQKSKHLGYNTLFVSSLFFILVLFKFYINISDASEIGKHNNNLNFSIAGATVISGYPIEGNLIIARTNPNYKLTLDNKHIDIDKDGIFVIGFHHDSNTKQILKIKRGENKFFETILIPDQRLYNIQSIQGLKKSMVTPPKEVINRIESDSRLVKKARNVWAPIGDFWLGIDWPLVGKITGAFGSQRILNGIPKTPHYGVDIAAPKGTLIKAPASGTITLAYNLYYSGFTVILNHGLGVNSTFLHLEKITVEVGDKIKRGELIGHVGNTGRSTGPHLDWRIDWKGHRLDAAMLAGPM